MTCHVTDEFATRTDTSPQTAVAAFAVYLIIAAPKRTSSGRVLFLGKTFVSSLFFMLRFQAVYYAENRLLLLI